MLFRLRCLYVSAMVAFLSLTVTAQSTVAPQRPGQALTLLSNGEILTTGGFDEAGHALRSAYLVKANGKVTKLESGLLYPRGWHTATALPDGRVLIFGGKDGDGHYVPTMEIFDPATQQFYPWTGVPLVPRASHTATMLTSGLVLIAGGTEAGGTFPDDIQLWDYRTGKIKTLQIAPEIPRQGHTATLLADGTVEISGGTDLYGSPVAQSEIFDPETETFHLIGTSNDTVSGQSTEFDVAQTIPADGAEQYPIAGYLKIRFTRLTNLSTVNSTTIRLQDANGNNVPATVHAAANGRLAFLIPDAALDPGADYTLTVGGVKDLSNDTIPESTVAFSTENDIDNGANDGWIPDAEALAGNWGSRTGLSSWQQLPPLQAPVGVTAVAGQALGLSGKPLPHVTLQIGDSKVQTDNTGRFLLKKVSPGNQVLVIDGATADSPRASYGLFEVGIDVKGGITNILNYTIWMTRLDTAHAVKIPSPTTAADTVITTPLIPGLELHLPPHTTIVDRAGHRVTELTITPIPVDKPPFPLPTGVRVPVYFTIQPGGSDINVQSTGTGIPGGRLYYPNTYHEPPGTPFNFWNYDATSRGWYIYGQGEVSKNGEQVIPDPGVVIYQLTGAMVGSNGAQPPVGASMNSVDGEPVDLSSGEFVYTRTDLTVSDVLPIRLTRTYITNDHYQRAFGIGTTLNYDMFVFGDTLPYTYQELILPNGSPIRFNRISSGTSYIGAVYKSTATAGDWYGATLSYNPSSIPGAFWVIRTRTGMLYGFPESAAENNQVNQALVGIEDRNGNMLKLTRNGSALLTQIASPSGRYINIARDAEGRIIQATDNGGRSVSYTYDSAGHLASVTDVNGGVTTFAYNSNDLMTSITDPRNITYLTNQYDSSGRVIEQTQADGSTYTFQWTPSGNASQEWISSGSTVDRYNSSDYEGFTGLISSVAVTDPRGYVRQVAFNNLGLTTTDTRASGQPEQQTSTYQYYADNLLQSVTDQLGRTTTYNYDANGNETSVTYLSGTSSAVTYTATFDPIFNNMLTRTDPLGHTETFTYDGSGNLSTIQDALGHTTTFTYTDNGEPASITDAAGDKTTFNYYAGTVVGITDPLGNTTQMFPDQFGRVVQSSDPLGNTSKYTYDNGNKLLSVTNSQGNTASFTYDPNGDLLSVQDYLSNVTKYTYDSMDRRITKTDPLNRTTTMTYDFAGNLASITDPKGQVTVHSFDGLDRLTFTGFGATGTGSGATYQSTLSYQYDGGNRMTSVTDSSSGTISRTYDGLNRLTGETSPQGTMSYTYDAAGRRTASQVSGGADITYGYDADNRLTGITDGPAQVSFSYDNANRRISLALPNGITAQYGYDQDSRITSTLYATAGTTVGNLTYAYDSDSRKIDVGGSLAATNVPLALEQATYDADNELLTWNSSSAAYDADGNMTTDVNGNQYVWNARNQLTQITGAANTSFAYDALGRRVSNTATASPTSYLYLGMNRVTETSAGSTASLLPGGLDEYFMRTDSSGTSVPLTNALGSTIAMTNSTGAIATTYWYSPYGITTVTGATSGNSSQYAGRENDQTGLYFYRARYYSPEIGRFISQDPAGLSAGLNLYAYAGDDPVDYRDPLGLDRGAGYGFGANPGMGPDGGSGDPAGPSDPSGPSSPPQGPPTPPAPPPQTPQPPQPPPCSPGSSPSPGPDPEQQVLNGINDAFTSEVSMAGGPTASGNPSKTAGPITPLPPLSEFPVAGLMGLYSYWGVAQGAFGFYHGYQEMGNGLANGLSLPPGGCS